MAGGLLPDSSLYGMQFLLSPWFIGLSVLSLIMMGIELWGLFRACKRHNASPIGQMCAKEDCLPTTGIAFAAVLYIFLTISYIFLPPILHNVF